MVLHHLVLISEARKFNIYTCKVSFLLALTLFLTLFSSPCPSNSLSFSRSLSRVPSAVLPVPPAGAHSAPGLGSQVPSHPQVTTCGMISFPFGLSAIP